MTWYQWKTASTQFQQIAANYSNFSKSHQIPELLYEIFLFLYVRNELRLSKTLCKPNEIHLQTISYPTTVGVHLLAYTIRSKIFCAAFKASHILALNCFIPCITPLPHPTLRLHPTGHLILSRDPHRPPAYPAFGLCPSLFLPPGMLFSWL